MTEAQKLPILLNTMASDDFDNNQSGNLTSDSRPRSNLPDNLLREEGGEDQTNLTQPSARAENELSNASLSKPALCRFTLQLSSAGGFAL